MSKEKKSIDFAPRTLGAGLVHKKDLILATILVAFGAFVIMRLENSRQHQKF